MNELERTALNEDKVIELADYFISENTTYREAIETSQP